MVLINPSTTFVFKTPAVFIAAENVPRQTATSSHHHKWNQIEIHHENQQVAPVSLPAAVESVDAGAGGSRR